MAARLAAAHVAAIRLSALHHAPCGSLTQRAAQAASATPTTTTPCRSTLVRRLGHVYRHGAATVLLSSPVPLGHRSLATLPGPSSFRGWVAVGTASIMAIVLVFRQYRASLLAWEDEHIKAHKDTSEAFIATQRQVEPTIRVFRHVGAAHEGSGEPVLAQEYIVDQTKYNEFVQRSVKALVAAQATIQQEASAALASELDACFEPLAARASNFADWYFSYTTSLKLMQKATVSLARNTVDVSDPTPLADAVSLDMNRYLTQQYEHIVLR